MQFFGYFGNLFLNGFRRIVGGLRFLIIDAKVFFKNFSSMKQMSLTVKTANNQTERERAREGEKGGARGRGKVRD